MFAGHDIGLTVCRLPCLLLVLLVLVLVMSCCRLAWNRNSECSMVQYLYRMTTAKVDATAGWGCMCVPPRSRFEKPRASWQRKSRPSVCMGPCLSK